MRLAAVALVCLLTACATRVDRIVVRDAQLPVMHDAGPGAEGARAAEVQGDLALEAHRIVEGKGAVFSRRTYDRGSPLVIDDEEFEILSWVATKIDTDESLEVERDGVQVLYSWGASAFPDQACTGVASSGRLDLEQRSEGAVHVRLDLRITANARGASAVECPDVEIIDEGLYEARAVSDLTPWLGAPFEHPYDASYPR
jgi:hypothetical protein